LIDAWDLRAPAPGPGRFTAGPDDAIILPLVVGACLVTAACRAVLVILVFAFDLVSGLALRLITLPILVAIAAGDGIVWLIKRLVGLPLLPRARRDVWRDRLDERWSALRRRMSPADVGTAAQSALAGVIARVFRKCGALSPGAALLVIVGALLWLPLSAAISLAIHAVLVAKAASLPAWAQLLHPVATVIAKSKVLVLPVYPAAWPQARKHAWLQTTLRCLDRVAALACVRKTAHRYRQARAILAGKRAA
jgi:hypothetical protein